MATVKVEGLRELEKRLAQLPKATGKNVLRRTLKSAGKPIAQEANALAPDDPSTPGGLSQSYAVSTKLNKNQKKAMRKAKADKAYVEVYVGTNDPAGVQQEFGNRNHGPQAHFRPAWDAKQGEALKIIKTDLGDEILKAAQRLARKAARGK